MYNKLEKIPSQHCLGELMKILSQDCWSLGQDLNPGPPKHEAHVITTCPHCTGTQEEKYTFGVHLTTLLRKYV